MHCPVRSAPVLDRQVQGTGSSNPDRIVQQIHHDFKGLVEYVTGEASRSRTAYEVELTLFRRLLALGAQLLRLFFVQRAVVRPSEPIAPDGTRLKYQERMFRRVDQREGEHIQRRAALTDGTEALQNRILSKFPDFELILDVIHASGSGCVILSEQNERRIYIDSSPPRSLS